MLVLGTDKSPFLDTLPESYLLIDDGGVIDRLALPKRRKITRLDFTKHTLNPLKGLTYERAEALVSLIDAAFPGGENTLTKQNSGIALLDALLSQKPRTLADLTFDEKDPDQKAAAQKIRRILLSPTLKRVLSRATNFTMSGIVLARLDAAVSRFDRLILGNLLCANYGKTVAIPDFPFYANKSHSQLIEEGRLIAGANTLSELDRHPDVRNLLLLGHKVGSHTTHEDAVVLAEYAGLQQDFTRRDNPYNRFIEECMRA